MRIKLLVEVDIDDNIYNLSDEKERLWFENEVLVGDGSLTIHSSDIGDDVGVVKKVLTIQYL